MESLATKAQNFERSWDRHLSKYASMRSMEQSTRIPKVYIALFFATFVFILLFFNIAGRLITNLIAWIYPAVESLKAIDSSDHSKRQQWFSYWVILGLLHSIEYFEDTLVYWLQFYFLFKAVFLLYLMLPSFKGASLIHTRIIKPNMDIITPKKASSPKLKLPLSPTSPKDKEKDASEPSSSKSK
ncbi:TB2/DP1, HVA22 family-domain-containing protein [Gongronella butleri]|nr:TB2/DP1, HVA22 family-domain-containing protein [Gongronella butleri]